MAPPRHTPVDRAVDRDAIPGQWAGRNDKVLKTGTSRRLRRSLRSRGGETPLYPVGLLPLGIPIHRRDRLSMESNSWITQVFYLLPVPNWDKKSCPVFCLL